ncbi:hypothetical protein PM082_009999 [Marasmius tenuissimus]|nr:hypothetical protein PM082_009999 [Marasmius tenuissimus]
MHGLSLHYHHSAPCREKLELAVEEDRSDDEDQQNSEPVPSPPSPYTGFYDVGELPSPPIPSIPHPPAQPPPNTLTLRVEIEEVEDEDVATESKKKVWIEDFPWDTGSTYGVGKTIFEDIRDDQLKQDCEPWAPFCSFDEWELARWLALCGTSMRSIDVTSMHLTLVYLTWSHHTWLVTSPPDPFRIRESLDPSFRNKCAFLKYIDALPTGPGWKWSELSVTRNLKGADRKELTKSLDVWHRDPVEVVKDLIGNPAFQDCLQYSPVRVYRDENSANREYGEMWSADWWWNVQEELPEGATVAPVIIASDETCLTTFSGDKKAWPVYLSIGNISQEVGRKPSSHAMVLIGYLLVSKLEIFDKTKRSSAQQQIFHEAMWILLKPLVEAGQSGIETICADGKIRHVFPLLAAYIADYPEQCLVACVKSTSCPSCNVDPKRQGVEPTYSRWRDNATTFKAIDDKLSGFALLDFDHLNLRPTHPFWDDLPHCSIAHSVTPDIHHQLHKGIFHDHAVGWGTNSLEIEGRKEGKEREVDARYRTMSPHPTLRHFKQGISLTSQWTGKEFKNMEKTCLGVLAGATDPKVIPTIRGVLDFIYLARLEKHTDETLKELEEAWRTIHSNKAILQELGIREHFNILKFHNIKHYPDHIRSRGSPAGFNSEISERLHIDFAKMGYRASNWNNYMKQMVKWLERREAIFRFDVYLQWSMTGGWMNEDEKEGEGDDELDDGDDDYDNSDMDNDNEANSNVLWDDKTEFTLGRSPYDVAQRTSVTTVASLEHEHHASHFLYYLQEFMDRNKIPTRALLDANSKISIWNRAKLSLRPLPMLGSSIEYDILHALKHIPAKRERDRLPVPEKPERFRTVLVRYNPRRNRQPGNDEMYNANPFSGLHVARLWEIFHFPERLGHYNKPLVFLDLFCPLREPVPDLLMYKIAISTHLNKKQSVILPYLL